MVYSVSELTVTPTGEPETMTVGKPGVAIGSRTRPAVVTRLADSVPVPILPRFDGKFSIYIFVGSLEAPNVLENLKAIDNYIRNSGGSIFSKYGANVDVHAKAIADRMPTFNCVVSKPFFVGMPKIGGSSKRIITASRLLVR